MSFMSISHQTNDIEVRDDTPKKMCKIWEHVPNCLTTPPSVTLNQQLYMCPV